MNTLPALLVVPVLALGLAAPGAARSAQEPGYRLPPPGVVRLVDAPPTPTASVSPDGRWLLLVERPSLPTLADVSRPWLPMAGTRVDPGAVRPWSASDPVGLVVQDLRAVRAGAAEGVERRLALPAEARVVSTAFSPDGGRLAYSLAAEGGSDLWVVELDGGEPRRVATRLAGVLDSGFGWTPDSAALVCLLRPEGFFEPPPRPPVPLGPRVQESRGRATPVRTYQDLLRDAHDEVLFAFYTTAQVARVDLEGRATPLGEPARVASAEPSPDGAHLLVEIVERPFSYVLPSWRFPRRFEVWSPDGEVERVVAEIPLGEGIPLHGVRTGPRSLQWRAGAPATLAWVEALDGGDPEAEVPHRDRWMTWDAPFADGAARELVRVEHRAWGVTWFADGARFVTTEFDRDVNRRRTLLHDPASDAGPVVLDDRNYRDRYADPGSLVTTRDARGSRVVREDGTSVYRSGRGASADGDRPFLDRLDLATGETVRLWRCAPGEYESVTGVVASRADAPPVVVTRRESASEPPNYHLLDLGAETGTALTEFPHPAPELAGIRKELLRYERDDGVALTATLYLPADHVEGERLPLVVWAYPLEFDDGATAGQVRGTPHRFTYPRGSSHLFFLTQGYAVLDGASMPVVGDPETVNDTFVEQIVAAARAGIEAAVERGAADPDRVGVGGHSYGAFMTANLLAHCDLFRAGVARSGAYNRTLTPFGFQSERRTLWEAPEVYFAISPFLHADDVDEPLLLLHGADDPNPGTFPVQSERMFHAIKGNGGVVRHVELPSEGHGYRARESVLHTLAEMFAWFDEHVKHAPPRAAEAGFGR